MRFYLVVPLLALLFCANCGKKPVADKSAGPLTDYVSMREEVVKRIKSGALKPDASGVVQLPSDLESVASDGRVLVANNPNAGLMILFKAMQLRPGETMGLLYSDHAPANVTDLAFLNFSLKVRRRVNDHWSEISFRS